MKGSVVVTGAAGFLGRRLVAAFVEAGYAVRATVRKPPVPPLPASVEVGIWDAAAGAPPASILQGAIALCHAAAFKPPSHVDPKFAEPCLAVNALGTLKLLEACVAATVPAFVYLSAGNAYAGADESVTEEGALYPAGHAPYYLTSKVVGEIWCSHFARTGRLAVSSLRPSAIYGPGMGVAGLIPNLIRGFRAGQPVTLSDGGRYRADLVHVDDVARAAVEVVNRRTAGVFNIGSGKATTALEIAQVLARLLGRSDQEICLEPASNGPPPGFARLDITKARAQLAFAPRPLAEGLRATVESYDMEG